MIGKILEEGDICFEVRKSFYEGKEFDENEFDKHFKKSGSLNIVGKESIKFALKKKLISKEDIKKIENIPFAIIVVVS